MGNGPDLSRFIQAQKQDYDTALREIRNGKKESHWMWYIFPQIRGLGTSRMSEYYAVQSRGEAAAFLEDPYLGRNLEEITRALLELDGNDAYAVFGYPDHMKLRSCMTLFACVSEEGSVFHRVLEKYFGGKPDTATLRLLGTDGIGGADPG